MERVISLNNLMIADVPDIYNLKDFEGHIGHHLFSAAHVIYQVQTNAEKLKIDLSVHDANDLPKLLSQALESSDKDVQSAAEGIAADLGRRLGVILYTLKTASEKNVEANNKDPKDWIIWTGIKKIFLAGGLANGCLGEKISFYAQELFRELNIKDCEIIAAKSPSNCQTIGCAMLNKDNCEKALLFDFGHTFVKAAMAFYDGDMLTKIKPLPKVPSQYITRGYTDKEAEKRDGASMHEFVLKTIADYFLKYAGEGCSKHLIISIANPVSGGKIAWGGCYYKLRLVSEEYEKHLQKCLSELIGEDIKITLVHDGEAAAVCFSGEKDAVMIALGTAFGVAFPTDREGLKNAENVEIIQ